LLGELEEPSAAVGLAGALGDEALLDELREDAREALLRYLEDAEELRDGEPGMTADEIDDAVMRPPEAVLGQHLVRLGGEVAVGDVRELCRLLHVRLAEEERRRDGFKVSHVDLFRMQCYRPRDVCDIKCRTCPETEQ